MIFSDKKGKRGYPFRYIILKGHFKMNPLFRLDNMLSDYRPLFKHKNFNHFDTFVKGLIMTAHRGTITEIYQTGKQSTTYWALQKFLSRGEWCVDKVTSVLRKRVQTTFSEGVYVYDETKSVNDGSHQYGTHFFRNTRYQKRNKNQSKFHHGHEFGAIGWLCETPEGTRLFPLAVRVMSPKKKQDSSLRVLKRLCAKIPPGLIIFDRGFNRRKVFRAILAQGHHLLCRAKSNAVFYYEPKPPKQPKGPGRPAIYGSRVHLPYLPYEDIIVNKTTLSVANKVVRTKMCPQVVRLVVIRERPKKSKKYRYFCLFTSDLERPVAELIQHYRNRWQIETAFRDVKQNFGFGTYQLRKRKGLNRFVQLSFIAATLTQLLFTKTATGTPSDTETEDMPPNVQDVLLALNKHWYKPKHLTRGLMVAYLQQCLRQHYFSASYDSNQDSKKNRKIVEDST